MPAMPNCLRWWGFHGWVRVGAEIGYAAHPDARGRGVVSAATRALAEHSLRPEPLGGFGFRRLWMHIAEPNTGSHRVAAAAGFSLAGRLRARSLVDGAPTDTLIYDRILGD